MSNRRNWYILIAGFYVFIVLSQYVNALKNFLELKPLVPCFILAILSCVVWLVSEKRNLNRYQSKYYVILMIATSTLFQTFTWSMMTYSKENIAPILATLPILIAVYHHEFFVLSKEYLWGMIPSLTASSIALLLAQSDFQSIIIAIGTLISVSAGFLMGTNALMLNALIKERDGLREALDANTLMESVNETEKAKDLLYEMMGANHDASNAITSVIMNIELLTSAIEDPREHEIVPELSNETRDSLNHLTQIIQKARDVGKDVHQGELVNVAQTIEELVKKLSSEYSDREIVLDLSELNEASFIKLHGGVLTLQRLLTNLVKNACEGDGINSANLISITLKAIESQLQIIIVDNGPGFSEAFLNSTASTYKTTKENGSGLGLYTCKRLITTNKGSMALANSADGGAMITVELPLSE